MQSWVQLLAVVLNRLVRVMQSRPFAVLDVSMGRGFHFVDCADATLGVDAVMIRSQIRIRRPKFGVQLLRLVPLRKMGSGY